MIHLSPVLAEDKIIAIVNHDIITSKDMNDFMNFTRVQLAQQYRGRELEEKTQAMKIDLLGRLIEDRLILQEAAKEKITIDPNRIKGRMDEIRRQYPTEADFHADLRKQGMVPADIEKRIREQMLIFTIIDRKVKSRVLVRPQEVTRYYDEHVIEFMEPEARDVEIYALDNQDLAKTFAYNLISGQKLQDLAARYPLTVNKLKIYKGEGVKKEIEETVFKLNIGEISQPVEVDSKFYIFKLEDIIPPRQATLAETQDDISGMLYGKRMEEGFRTWIDGLKKQAYIKILDK